MELRKLDIIKWHLRKSIIKNLYLNHHRFPFLFIFTRIQLSWHAMSDGPHLWFHLQTDSPWCGSLGTKVCPISSPLRLATPYYNPRVRYFVTVWCQRNAATTAAASIFFRNKCDQIYFWNRAWKERTLTISKRFGLRRETNTLRLYKTKYVTRLI